MRLAAADRPYTYRNSLGGQRQEIVTPESLFRKDSTDTFKMLPLTLRHPSSRIVTPSNAGQLMKGSTGHTVVREKTTDGEFLGIVASVFDRETIDAIDNGWQVSPGYRVKTKQRADGMFEQHGRDGNHVAVVERARGGADVLPVLNGINIDGDIEDDQDFWFVADSDDSPIYTARFDEDLILPILAEANLDEVAAKTAVDLNRYKISQPEAPETAIAEGEKSLADGNEPRTQSEQPNQDACTDCGADCDCKSCKSKKTKGKGKTPRNPKNMASITVDGVTYDVDSALAQAIAPHLERSDSLDEALELNEQLAEALTESKEALDGASENIDSLTEELEAANERADSAINTDGDDEYAIEINIDAVELVSSVREDAALIINAGFLNLDEAAKSELQGLGTRDILENLDGVQRSIITAVNPAMVPVLDNLDGDGVTAAYDASMAMFRSQAAQQAQQMNSDADDGFNSDMGGSMPYGSYGMKAKMPGGKHGKQRDIRKAMKHFHAQQDEAFKSAGEALSKSGKNGLIVL